MTAIFKITNLPIFTHRMKKRKVQLQRRRTMHKRIIVELDKWIQKNFESGGKNAYPGTGWEKLDKRTIMAKQRGWGEYVAASKPMILHNKGFLKGRWGAAYSNRGASYYSKVLYGIFHHEGTKNMPERRILPTEKQFRPILRKMGLKHIKVALD